MRSISERANALSTRRHATAVRGRAAGVRRDSKADNGENRNGSNLSTCLSIIEMCYGDVGLLLTMPRQGLGNSAIASVA